MKNQLKTLIAAAALCTCSLTAAAADDAAASYPSGTITMICSHGAGGDTDYNARLISRRLEERLGVSIVVTNVTGANGSIALTQYKDENPDGYTLIATNAMAMVSNEVSGLSDFGYDAFEVVGIYGRQCGENLLVRADNPAENLEDLIAATKANPGRITLGVAIGGSSYIAGLIMQTTREAAFAMVDAGGDGAERLTSLLGGHIDVTIAPYTLAREYIESGKVKSLCTMMSQRLPGTPDIPTAAESGVPGLALDTLYVILAPKGTPAEITAKLNAAICDIAYHDAEYQEAIRSFNFQEPYALDIEQSEAVLRQQREHMMSYAPYLQ